MTRGPILIHSLDDKRAARLDKSIDNILRDPKGVPNGKDKRTN